MRGIQEVRECSGVFIAIIFAADVQQMEVTYDDSSIVYQVKGATTLSGYFLCIRDLEGCGMKSESMADISILISNSFVLYMNLTQLQCAMMHIASLMVIRSGSHTMQRDCHLKLRHLPCSQFINHNVLVSLTISTPEYGMT